MNLVANEWMKILKKASTWVMVGLLVVIIVGVGGLDKYIELDQKTAEKSSDWKQSLTEETEMLKAERAEYPDSSDFYNRHIALNEYRLANNIPPENELTAWSFVNEMVPLIDFIAIITITIAAGIVASEFSTGTIKLLLIRPVSRVKILLSKYVTVILFSIGTVLFTFAVTWIIGAVLFGLGDAGPYLAYTNGEVIERSQLANALFTYGMSSIGLFMLTTMAFMISAAFRNSSLAIGISIFLLLMGGNITSILAMKFEWAKYSLFANTNLMSYFDGRPLFDDMTIGFSIVVLMAYFIIFNLIAFLFFVKRDVRA
ncbi:ABC transporter permease [Bacillus sp. AGMB 02131]|uniref:ABC transporter permease n=1 Tax=Peribacillus faecalis TaxID=2772559 RepID=A0A927CT28_9BACI|nr:ABC transporter permease [Peribacillus faecalis]MBD3107358.1 ABC transporter permease [Peribacillus faecalis]